MAALFRCFRKKEKGDTNSNAEAPVDKRSCGQCKELKKASELAHCPNCKVTLFGYWEKNENPPATKVNGSVKEGGFCSKIVPNGDTKTGQVDTDSSGGENSPTNPMPTNSPLVPGENSNGDAPVDYRPSAQSNLKGMSYNFVSKDDPNYNMHNRRRGKALIFNFDKYKSTPNSYLDTTPSRRRGSKKDRDDLKACLEGLSFEVIPYNNLDTLDFVNAIDEVRREDHSDADCILVAIMTHGIQHSIFLSDGTLIPVNNIWQEFEANKCPTLAGKPKIFLIQACRGENYDHGTSMLGGDRRESSLRDITDSGTFSYVIPNAADIIVAFSCPLGHYSWRSQERGSWFIQSICKVFNEHAYNMELQSLLTAAAREVAVNYESNTDSVHDNKKKQVPSTSSTLIRNVFFTPKPFVKYQRPPAAAGNCCVIESATQTAEEENISNGISNISLQQVQVAVAGAQQVVAQSNYEINENGGIVNGGVVPLPPLVTYAVVGPQTALDGAGGTTPDDGKGEPSATESSLEDDLSQDANEQQVRSSTQL